MRLYNHVSLGARGGASPSLCATKEASAHAQQRLKEAEKLGFGQAVLPKIGEESAGSMGVGSFQPGVLADLVARIAGPARSETQAYD